MYIHITLHNMIICDIYICMYTPGQRYQGHFDGFFPSLFVSGLSLVEGYRLCQNFQLSRSQLHPHLPDVKCCSVIWQAVWWRNSNSIVNFCLYNQKLFASAMVPLEGFFFYSDATQSLSDSITHSPMLTFNRTVRKTCLPFTHLWLRGCRFQEVCKGMLQDSWALARQSLTGDSFSTWDRAQDSWSCQVSPFCSFLTPAWARNTQLLSWLGNEEFWHN